MLGNFGTNVKEMRVLIGILMIVNVVKGWDSCHQGRCFCADEVVSCYGVDNPYFDYRPMIKYVYLENVYVSYVERLVISFPNLRLISLENMQFINCVDVFNLMKGVEITGSYCTLTMTGK